ncbi:MAG: hypothetical protein KGJ13_02525 [Patescibacteria group bacterium]|nr:hypothetical protein [Patescibacteria group bacterium]
MPFKIQTSPKGATTAILLLAFLFCFGIASVSHADAAASPAVSCNLQSAAFNRIQAIQNDPTLGYAEELKAELAARRQLLTITINCALEDAQTLQSNLNNLQVDPGFLNLQTQLSENLDTSINFYNIQLSKVPTAGIAATQTIAKDVLAWRESNYAPLAATVSNFVLWIKNQPLFTAADNRLGEIKNLAQSVPFSDNTDLQTELQGAKSSLRAAEDANTLAKNSLAHPTYPDPSLGYIQQSLSSLSDTYQHFFNIASLVQTLLPH